MLFYRGDEILGIQLNFDKYLQFLLDESNWWNGMVSMKMVNGVRFRWKKFFSPSAHVYSRFDCSNFHHHLRRSIHWRDLIQLAIVGACALRGIGIELLRRRRPELQTKNLFVFSFIWKMKTGLHIPVRYATLSELTSNLSRCIGLATIPRSIVRIRDVLETVVGVGCRYPLIRWPTSAKWKLLLNDKPTAWSSCLKCHSNGSRVANITSLRFWKLTKKNEILRSEDELISDIYISIENSLWVECMQILFQ